MPKKALFSLGLLSIFSLSASSINYETYLESWDSSWNSAMTGLPPGPGGTSGTSYDGVTLSLAFGAYIFNDPPSSPWVSGFQFTNASTDIVTAALYVQSHGGKAKISFGGASYASPYYPNYFISQTTQNGGWPANMDVLANGVIAAVLAYNLDGVDFDIEDIQPSYTNAQGFADDLVSFLKLVRAGLPNSTITITIPGQGWGTYWQYLAQGAAAVDGLIDAISFMEYDIWVNPSLPSGYPQQIESDIVTYNAPTNTSPAPNYSPGWGIPYSKIQVGLMFANDDNGNFLSTTAASSLTSLAADKDLVGVMGWDLDRDAGTDPSPPPVGDPPYAYSEAIRSAIADPEPLSAFQVYPSVSSRNVSIQQTCPYATQTLHGAP